MAKASAQDHKTLMLQRMFKLRSDPKLKVLPDAAECVLDE